MASKVITRKVTAKHKMAFIRTNTLKATTTKTKPITSNTVSPLRATTTKSETCLFHAELSS